MRLWRTMFIWLAIFFTFLSPAYADSFDTVVHDAARNRDIPVRIYLPETTSPSPVILFSHGLGGSRENYTYLGNAWSQHGYVTIMMQHEGSDDAVWKDKGKIRALIDMRRAASAQNLIARAADVSAVITHLKTWNEDTQSPLHHRLDLGHIGMSGHSFGASTTQAVAGQSYARRGAALMDPRITAFLAMSPSMPDDGGEGAFAAIQRPFMVMTGTNDNSPIRPMPPAERQKVYASLPAGNKYQLVLSDATHMTFSGRQKEKDARADYQDVIVQISNAFWDAYLKDDPNALAWLQGQAVRIILQSADIWQVK